MIGDLFAPWTTILWARQDEVSRLAPMPQLDRRIDGRIITSPPADPTNFDGRLRDDAGERSRFMAECPCGHIHESTPHRVKAGTVKCPHCTEVGWDVVTLRRLIAAAA